MLPGTGPDGEGSTDLNTLFDGAGKVAAGTMTEEELAYFEDTACPTCGSCSGMFTANSMNCLCEALGDRPSRQRHRAGRLFRTDSSGQARGHEGDGACCARWRAHQGHFERRRRAQRHGVRHGLRRLHQHGAAPNGHRERGGVPHHHGRLGCGQCPHAALGEARALRPAPAHRPVPRRRGAGGHGGAGAVWACSTRAPSPAWGLCPSTWRAAARRPTARCAVRARTPIPGWAPSRCSTATWRLTARW